MGEHHSKLVTQQENLSLCLLFKLQKLIYKSELLKTCSKFTQHLLGFFYEEHKSSYTVLLISIENTLLKNLRSSFGVARCDKPGTGPTLWDQYLPCMGWATSPWGGKSCPPSPTPGGAHASHKRLPARASECCGNGSLEPPGCVCGGEPSLG